MMKRPRICAVITGNNPETIRNVEPLVDLFEVRIDLIGDGWKEVARALRKPWIACNRRTDEGGKWQGTESERIDRLLQAVSFGADMVDIEVQTKGMSEILPRIKGRAECLLSYHDLTGTPSFDDMKRILEREIQAGADVCKVVTTARASVDNLNVMRLIRDFQGRRVVSFAMGPLGILSRVLCPVMGGDFTYASIEKGGESAPGQITVTELRSMYEMMKP